MAKICNLNRWYIFSSLYFCFLFVNAQDLNPINGWKYVAQDVKFAERILSLRGENQFEEAANKAFESMTSKKNDGLQKLEAKLYLAQNLSSIGISAIAIEYYKEIIKENPGSFISLQALVELNQSLPVTPFHHDDLSHLFNRGAFKEVPEGIESMVYYFIGLSNFKIKENTWAKEVTAKINPETYWGQQLKYFKAIYLVKKNKLVEARDLFKELSENLKTHVEIKKNSILQLARLYFELKSYENAEVEYLKLENIGRVTGRILFERALVAYYQKKFAQALGLLESLKSENFSTSFNLDQILLEMMIYRDLCHYPTVKKIAVEFDKKYSNLIDYLKSASDLTKSQTLKKMVLQNFKYKDYADLIHKLRSEKKEIKTNFKILSSTLIAKVSKDIDEYEDKFQLDTDNMVSKELNNIAQVFFKKTEEIRLLEYVSGLDEFRIKNIFENRTFKSKDEDRYSNYKLLYWPVEKEYWWDEYRNYQVILVDRCDGSSLSRGK